MPSPTAACALAFVAGVGVGVSVDVPAAAPELLAICLLLLVTAAACWWLESAARRRLGAAACMIAGLLHGAAAREQALHSPLRARLDAALGGVSIDSVGVVGRHEPLRLRAVLTADAAAAGDGVALRVESRALLIGGRWQQVSGGIVVSVSGTNGRERVSGWSAGRTIEAPMSFRRPTRYLNTGVIDFERDAALSGITLFASIKSPLLVDVVGRGAVVDEWAAAARRAVRGAVTRWVAPHGETAAAIVTAVLIGDRAGLPDDVRSRLQAAGTYHVIAISGGNIAILAALVIGLLAAVAVRGRPASLLAIGALMAYAQVAAAGPSVWRATLMGVLYFCARVFDHRTPPWHALAVSAAVIAAVQPLDVRDAGFLLTFGATAGLLAIARLLPAWLPRMRPPAWIAASMAASLAAEVVLLPVSAFAFSRVTGAGLVLNLVAIPAMTVVQLAGMLVIAVQRVEWLGTVSGWIAAYGAVVLVESARLVDLVPWVVRRVPPPPIWIVGGYYVALLSLWYVRGGRRRLAARVAFAILGLLIVTGADPFGPAAMSDGLRLTMLDVGQGESLLLEAAGAEPLLIDAGGAPFGGGFDIGTRVLAPALWARGVRRLGDLLVTHGDPDHIGGAAAVLSDFRPAVVWWGIPVPGHLPSAAFLTASQRVSRIEYRHAGEIFAFGRATVRVLNPPAPDWERPRVRNDDSVVLSVSYGDVALLLTGDISADVERAIIPHLPPAPIRVLKVAHHGSRTSSSPPLLDAWRPQTALISCGRGNSFGHPAAEVVERLQSIGARIYRTDRDGEITLQTDGHTVRVTTFTGEKQ